MLDRRAYYAEVKELENDFDSYIRALDGIVFNNSAQVFFEVVFIKYLEDNNTKKMSVAVWNSEKNLRNFKRMLFKNKVFYRHVKDKENVYVAVTPKTRKINFIWLDDIKKENLTNEQLKYFTLIETSPNNYQAWVRLNDFYDVREVQVVKKYLIKQLGADPAASGIIQPMRLPGFYNYKPNAVGHLVKVYKEAEKKLPFLALLKKAKKQLEGKGDVIVKTRGNVKSPEKMINPLTLWDKLEVELTKVISEKQGEKVVTEIKVDKNVVDQHYVFRLVKAGYSKSEILNYLKTVRPDIEHKHKFSDYFERTYLKAKLYALMNPDDFYYENRFIAELIRENCPADKKVIDFLREKVQNLSSA